MHQTSEAIERFFRTFESNTNSDNVGATAALFADVFMAAGPQGAQVVRAGDFALAVPKKKQFFDSLGCRSTELVSLTETRLDGRYTMATTQWKMAFARPGIESQEVIAASVYIVDTGGPEPKVVFYLANQDLMQVLKDRGLAAV